MPCFRGQLVMILALWGGGALLASAQVKSWDRTFGGTDTESLASAMQTPDGGYILAGSSSSDKGGDKSDVNRGNGWGDFWVLRLDSAGNKLWDKTYGGDRGDYCYALQLTRDGGYILGGYSFSGKSGDKSEAARSGNADFWVLRLDAEGNKVWDRTLGGNRASRIQVLQQTRDGGYILGGDSESGKSLDKSEENQANCSGEYCTSDFWVVKLDAEGNKEWDKTLGGAKTEEIQALQQTSDGGYILGGGSNSDAGGTKTQGNLGNYDYWVVKLDAAGNKQWDKTFGTEGYDYLHALQQTSDGGFVLGGNSDSGRGGDKSEDNRDNCTIPFFCTSDYWILKLDAAGNKLWDKTFGGSDIENLHDLRQTADGGYILGGDSQSDKSGDKSEDGPGDWMDFWVLKLDAAGNKTWDKTYGGSKYDFLSTIQQTRDGGYILGGTSESQASGDKSEDNRGPCHPDFGCSFDYWVLKISLDQARPRLSSFLPKKDVPGTEVTIRGQGFASTWAVRFNGLEAAFQVLSDEVIRAIVPANAASGKITVANAAGVVVSPGSFWVRHPRITAFRPAQGAAGDTVFLQGNRLSTAKEVFFGGVKTLAFTVLTDSTLTAVVPAGASGKGRIKVVLAGGGYGNSITKFVVTVPDSAALAGRQAARQAVNGQAQDLARVRVEACPNPFSQQVTFRFRLPAAQPTEVKVFDMLGRELSVLYRGEATAGQPQEVVWRPQPQQADGLYLIRLLTPGQVQQTRVLLAR